MEDAAQCLPDPCSDGLTRSAMDAPLAPVGRRSSCLVGHFFRRLFLGALARAGGSGRPALRGVRDWTALSSIDAAERSNKAASLTIEVETPAGHAFSCASAYGRSYAPSQPRRALRAALN